MLLEFGFLFDEPVCLLSDRACNHKILLAHGADPVVVRRYRYPRGQKDEIERNCAEMLAKGIIWPNTSLFSLSVLLVQKTNDSWQFCVDYRALNAHMS